MYSIHAVSVFNIPDLCRVERILYRCGKDMAERYNLFHWNHSHIKNMAVVALCALKNRIYLVRDSSDKAIATYQTKITEDTLLFSKLATDPAFAGKGVGTFCMESIERMAAEKSCHNVCLEVYDQSRHAIRFYKNRGYVECGSVRTRKHTALKMKKHLEK